MFDSDQVSEGAGILYVVATPIGNLEDITQRAIRVLTEADWILAEDTRNTSAMLQAYGISNSLVSLHEHNEAQRIEGIVERLHRGESGALVSDAGTPLINDPGYQLVKALREQGFSVVPIPGASAVITALSAAGMATNRFTYEGFLPARSSKRQQALQSLKDEPRTMVFYESPHRIVECLQDMLSVFGEEREVAVGRELTKKFEQFVGGTLADVVAFFAKHADKVRGEFVVMISSAEDETAQESSDLDGFMMAMLNQGLPVKQISQILADATGVNKKQIYQRVLELKEAE